VPSPIEPPAAPAAARRPLLAPPPPSPARAQVQAWSLQRARLEEEIVRRQEASRYAGPSHPQPSQPPAISGRGGGGGGGHSGEGGEGLGGQLGPDSGYISAYRNVAVDRLGLRNGGGGSELPQLAGLLLPVPVGETARMVRAGRRGRGRRRCRGRGGARPLCVVA
jgi:hypothetical protein